MPYTEEGKILINNLFDLKCYNGKHLVSEFSNKGCNVGLVYQLLQKLQVTGWVDRCSGSSRWRSTRTSDLDELVLHTNGQASNNICTLYVMLWQRIINIVVKCRRYSKRSRHCIPHRWKDLISTVRGSQDSAETIVRTLRGGIANHHSIVYSPSNISAKNYQNRLMCVEVIVCKVSVVFGDTVFHCLHVCVQLKYLLTLLNLLKVFKVKKVFVWNWSNITTNSMHTE